MEQTIKQESVATLYKWNADKLLANAGRIWVSVAFVGFILFGVYIIQYYLGNAMKGNLAAWNEASIKGYLPGDLWGNIFFASHLAMAVILTFGGIIQLIPALRKRSIELHRWNGRLYLMAAIIAAVGGLYLVWIRGSTLNNWGSVTITINAMLILVFSLVTWLKARRHLVDSHRKWALRTFMMASGVWFLRIGMMAWIILNGGPVGTTENLDGPFDRVWSLGHFLLPLALLEIYFWISQSSSGRLKIGFAILLIILTIITAIGIFGASSFMWF